MCASDERCTDGFTWCAPCNGHGVLTMGGKRYRRAINIGRTAVTHELCAGTGMAVCGCVDFTKQEIVDMFGVKT